MPGKGFALNGHEDYSGREDRETRLRDRAERQRRQAEAKKKQKNDDVVEYVVIKCQRCGSEKCRIYKHDRPVRYHKCVDCGYNFKSIEKK